MKKVRVYKRDGRGRFATTGAAKVRLGMPVYARGRRKGAVASEMTVEGFQREHERVKRGIRRMKDKEGYYLWDRTNMGRADRASHQRYQLERKLRALGSVRVRGRLADLQPQPPSPERRERKPVKPGTKLSSGHTVMGQFGEHEYATYGKPGAEQVMRRKVGDPDHAWRWEASLDHWKRYPGLDAQRAIARQQPGAVTTRKSRLKRQRRSVRVRTSLPRFNRKAHLVKVRAAKQAQR